MFATRWRFVFIASIAMTARLSAQSIFTVAGGGTDDGRPATAAGLTGPQGLALDAAGNVFIADGESMRIRKVSARSGIISTVAGNGARAFSGDGGPATAAGLNIPDGVVVDAAGNLFIADTENGRIRKVAAGSGIISTVAGNGESVYSGDGGLATAAELNFPEGVALDASGNLYIADLLNYRIRKVAAGSGIISTVAGNGTYGFSGDGGPATAAELAAGGVALDALGNLYIAGNNRIRKVDVGSGIISTVAGNGTDGFSGDGGPATAAGLAAGGVALDAFGNLYIAGNNRIRKVDARSGIISTVAGNGAQAFSGDDGPATAASLNSPSGVALDASGNLYIADNFNDRIRKVAAGSGIISTVAGNGTRTFSGDGGPATAAGLNAPLGVALDAPENLYVADRSNHRIRKVAAGTGIISTVAGNGLSGFSGDGGPATAAGLNSPTGVALDASGNLYIADTANHRIRKVAAESGIISTVAGSGPVGISPVGISNGSFSGDGGPATAASLNVPKFVALDTTGNLYIADSWNHRIRRVAAGSGIISTVAGSGLTQIVNGESVGTFSGDDGPATAAGLNFPEGVAVDASGNLYIADLANNRIRKVAAGSGIISTVAGNGAFAFSGDGGPATAAALSYPAGVVVDVAGNLLIADTENNRIRKFTVVSGMISTVAGSDSQAFSGDGGPVTAASLRFPHCVALDASGNLYIPDSDSNRVRAVFACVTVPAPNLQQPSNASSSVPNSPRLAWSAAKGAFHYDVYLDTANPPQTVVASDITAPTYSPANLEPLTQYYWKVVAKGDAFCVPFSMAGSDVFSFTTTGTCGPPGPVVSAAAGSER